jgi:uncharacterized membrane protein (UPF0127 family)
MSRAEVRIENAQGDAVFLDGNLSVLVVRPHVRPWRIAGRRGAHSVLELSAGDAARHALEPGTSLRMRERNGGGDGD